LEKVLAAMQVPFPELTVLHLILRGEILLGETVPVIPDSILGGSAPLRFIELELEGIPFSGLPHNYLATLYPRKKSLLLLSSARFSVLQITLQQRSITTC
jgi:hypothetical protein